MITIKGKPIECGKHTYEVNTKSRRAEVPHSQEAIDKGLIGHYQTWADAEAMARTFLHNNPTRKLVFITKWNEADELEKEYKVTQPRGHKATHSKPQRRRQARELRRMLQRGLDEGNMEIWAELAELIASGEAEIIGVDDEQGH